MRRLILFLVRKRLGLKKYEHFRFTNQRSKTDTYYFGETILWKRIVGDIDCPSNVSLNWILDHECEIEKVEGV